MKTWPIPTIPHRESPGDRHCEREKGPSPYHVSERGRALRTCATPCEHNCRHPACAQGCKVEDRKRAFMEGQ